MAEADDPTRKYMEATEKFQERLHKLWKVVFKKVSSHLRSMVSFIRQVVTVAKELAATVGKSVVDKVVRAGQTVEAMITAIPILLKATLLLGKRIIAVIKKAADPKAVIVALKKLFARYVRMLIQIFVFITNLIQELDILGTVFSVIGTFQSVLRMIFSWITEVTGAKDGTAKAQGMLKKVWKEMKKEVKEAQLLRKQVMKLKLPA
ncbi:hypothetical protein HKX54_12840 [Sulfitobacter sp. M57]|uniref:hypothetical protein n=1 Tax=unclassified Sulfitobacter TaxID=196795 RepID=UPI0023E16B22|nr:MULTISPECIES: hypothetical protein [unclassified Sulfitobacter]MDF3415349.1 hypothetical protein [Sulfitobacter sp. KE5]MDF3422830.1 hypothetical protein [Sulfitobacter sp. KE43]MDF3433895.1 hypothetical protein [Sulfitobacter sp. KE42]MDF3459535.1 hypothetical protein [Sulfitobacter sp. S74]MDF3463434.1 hypothetical protein [Sulfitobacter sp. Ks18]